jgi:hypothetical protein
MNTTKLIRAALMMILLSMINTSVFSQEELTSINFSLPPIQSQGQIEFLTGGIGLDESQAILQEGGKWPLMLELAKASTPGAAYISDVQISIKDVSGTTVLETITDGPYLLAKLPQGKYSLDATYDGETLHRDFTLQQRHKKITLLWPALKISE